MNITSVQHYFNKTFTTYWKTFRKIVALSGLHFMCVCNSHCIIQLCTGRCLTTRSPKSKLNKPRPLVCFFYSFSNVNSGVNSGIQFHCGHFQASNLTLLNVELKRGACYNSSLESE